MENNSTDEAVGFTIHDEKTGNVSPGEKKEERRTSQEARYY